MSKITYAHVYDATTFCFKERIRLRALDRSNTLLLFDPLGIEGEKWLLENFWPETDQISDNHYENLFQTWINYYLALSFARMKVEYQMRYLK